MAIPRILKIKYLKCLPVLMLASSLSACSGGDGGLGSGAIFGDLGLNWSVPGFREDGTTLIGTEISAYRIYYGTASGDYPDEVEVKVGSNNVDIPQIPVGTYYVVVTAVDTDGRESRYSSPELVVKI